MKKIVIAVITLTALVCAVILAQNLNSADVKETTEATQSTAPSTPEKTLRSIALGYYEDKGFNPYTTKSPTNLKISTLIYDSLFVLNEDWSVDILIASEAVNEGKKLTVTIVEDASFSNGATLSAYDVVYSFKLAKKSTFFKGRLSNFVSAEIDNNKVVFTLRNPDVFAESCLTFPIVQNNTGTATLPIGSGRYTLINHQGEYILTENPLSTRKENLSAKHISLTPITSQENQVYLIQTGKLSFFYDEMTTGKTANVNANTRSLSTNHLIYLGYNSQSNVFKDKNVAEALYRAIDRSTIADTCFDNICTNTYVPFNPNWYMVKNIPLPEYEYSTIHAGEILDSIGCCFKDTKQQYRIYEGDWFDMSFIVNEENEQRVALAKLITENLKSLGVKVTLYTLPFKEYVADLKEGDYDLYLGEIKLSPNMDLSSFFTKGGGASYGISPTSTIAKAYSDFRGGNIDITTFLKVFDAEKPFIPLFFKGALTYYSKEIVFEGEPNENEPFRHIYSWSNVNTLKTES